MKNTLKIIALTGLFAGALFADEASALSVTATMGFESEYIYRGQELADKSLQASVEASYDIYGGSAYVGAWVNMPITNSTTNEVDLYAGFKTVVEENYTVDAGVRYYWYPEAADPKTESTELYAGVTYAGLYVNPAVYAFYDLDLEQWVLQVSGDYSWSLADLGVEDTVLKVGAYFGVLSSDDTNGKVAAGGENGYNFYGVTADAVYSFSDSASASIGVRYAGNSDDVGESENFFFGAGLKAGF